MNFAVEFVTFPVLTVKFQSPESTNFVALDRLDGLIVALMGFCVTKISELISPLAEKVSIGGITDAVIPVVFPFMTIVNTGILVNSVDPGWVATDMGGHGGRPVQEGSKGIVWAATLPDNGPSGGFFCDGKAVPW
jgi:hypothetical protein